MDAQRFKRKRDAAILAYRELGLVPIPLKPQSKLPLCPGWQKGDASMWKTAPSDANVGLLTGDPGGGLVGLDFDEPDLCRQVLGIQARNLAAMTGVVLTRRGHHVYALHKGVQTCEPIKDCKSFSVLGTGSLIVAPPSIHPSGWEYRFLEAPRRIASLTEFADPSILKRERTAVASSPAVGSAPMATLPNGEMVPHAVAAEIVKRQHSPVIAAWELLCGEPAPAHALGGSGSDPWSRADWLVALCLIQHGEEPERVARLLMTLPGSKAAARGGKYALRTCLRAAETAHTGRLPGRV